MNAFHITNLGCKVNQIEMEQLTQDLCERGFWHSTRAAESNIGIVNTCTVTEKADGKSLRAIRWYARQPNIDYLFVTGCYSELEKNLRERVKQITAVIPQSKKSEAASVIEAVVMKDVAADEGDASKISNKWDFYRRSRNAPSSMQSDQTRFYRRRRAFIKIQDGCNTFCSYCRIPFARGAPVSRSAADILTQVTQLVDKNVGEIVLSGINIGTYKDHGLSFGELLQSILNRSKQTIIRISSIEPYSLDAAFFRALRHKNLAPHIHLALQGTSDLVLRAMRRRYTLSEFRSIVDAFRSVDPNFSISTDIITGFPVETEQMFEEGLGFVEACGFSKLHVFPYSARGFTKSAEQHNDLPAEVKKARSKKLALLSKNLELQHYKNLLDRKQRFVVEREFSSEELGAFGDLNPQQYNYFGGTSEYYVKGIIAVPRSEEVVLGQNLWAQLVQAEPSALLVRVLG